MVMRWANKFVVHNFELVKIKFYSLSFYNWHVLICTIKLIAVKLQLFRASFADGLLPIVHKSITVWTKSSLAHASKFSASVLSNHCQEGFTDFKYTRLVGLASLYV